MLSDLREKGGGHFFNFDDTSVLKGAIESPAFIRDYIDNTCYIDEVQRAEDALIDEIKAIVDYNRKPGQFVLAGSTRFLEDPIITESLAGRAVIAEVWPLNQSEIVGSQSNFIDRIFDGNKFLCRKNFDMYSRNDYFTMICRGGFPEAVFAKNTRMRKMWFASYFQAIIDRDVRAMSRINQPSAAAQVLKAICSLTAQELKTSTLESKLALNRETIERYLELLRTVFMWHRLPVWSRNTSTRMVKSPKCHMVDTGLTAHVLGIKPDKLAQFLCPERGQLVESFVFAELKKQACWSDNYVDFYHYRDQDRTEVDLVIENGDGTAVGIEVKSSNPVRAEDFVNLKKLHRKFSDNLIHGYVIYLGEKIISFGEKFTAIPLALLWE